MPASSLQATAPTASAPAVRRTVEAWLDAHAPDVSVATGLPEFDDRRGQWRVSLLAAHRDREGVGEVRVVGGRVVDATPVDLLTDRCRAAAPAAKTAGADEVCVAEVPSTLVLGDACEALADFPPDTAQLVCTSPPYYNAKPEYHESRNYAEYLDLLRTVFGLCADLLSEGRFLAVNVSPVLVRRTHRNTASRRLPIHFDLHGVLDGLGFEFQEDIIWRKPEGAGWHMGRGRRFAADRHPLQYKPVATTEHILVYRKRTQRLIDWNIARHPDPEAVAASRIEDGYEVTDVWDLKPVHRREHPAVYPEGLAERIVRYWSFRGDLVLDPFAGTGTTARVAGRLGRRFLMVEKQPRYFDLMMGDLELMCHAPAVRGAP